MWAPALSCLQAEQMPSRSGLPNRTPTAQNTARRSGTEPQQSRENPTRGSCRRRFPRRSLLKYKAGLLGAERRTSRRQLSKSWKLTLGPRQSRKRVQTTRRLPKPAPRFYRGLQDLQFQPETCHQPQARAEAQDQSLREAQDQSLRETQDQSLREAQDQSLPEAQDQSLREAQDQGWLPAQGLLQKEFQDQPLQELHHQPEMEEGACDQVHKEVCECGQAEAQHQDRDECGLVSGCITQHLRRREFTVWSALLRFPKTDVMRVSSKYGEGFAELWEKTEFHKTVVASGDLQIKRQNQQKAWM
ncbi:uncharacterized protein LOC132385642 [Hypanus sabinus]|uniref:uncharacterized protein LOC132385642 n=1 Tax=Hypanus sabinus TaxID=79690 RepID=UPI0028C3D0B9|nr:uncharacterized protein LOC132385642 [Hypanus sabinus]